MEPVIILVISGVNVVVQSIAVIEGRKIRNVEGYMVILKTHIVTLGILVIALLSRQYLVV